MPEMKVPTPPSAPMINIGGKTPETQPETPLTLEPDPVNPEPDDIPDVELPETLKAALEPSTEPSSTALPYDALLQGFCTHLMKRLDQELLASGKDLMKVLDAMGMAMQRWGERTMQANEHSAYQLSNALEALQKGGIHMTTAPYRVTLQACTPSGYPVTFDVLKDSANALVEELNNLTAWLVSQGYKPVS